MCIPLSQLVIYGLYIIDTYTKKEKNLTGLQRCASLTQKYEGTLGKLASS